jgi:hypothetical protein
MSSVTPITAKLRIAALAGPLLAGLLLAGGCGPLDTPATPTATTVSVPATATQPPSPTPVAPAPTTTTAPTQAAPTQAAAAGGGGTGTGSGSGGACAADEYRNSDGNCVRRPVPADSPPAGATAQCNDGTYSFSQHRSGTCSHHGGVRRWL